MGREIINRKVHVYVCKIIGRHYYMSPLHCISVQATERKHKGAPTQVSGFQELFEKAGEVYQQLLKKVSRKESR